MKSGLIKSDAEFLAQFQPRSVTDYLIDTLTPLMIFIMVESVIMFLLDIRYIYTEVHNENLRFVSFFFIMGVVALNRLIARDGAQESQLYIVALAGVMGLYTLATTEIYDVGSVARGFLNDPWKAAGFNMLVVTLVWWVTNRLTHECCVDDNPVAGDVGILTGTARRIQKAIAAEPGPAQKKESGGWFRRKKKPIVPEFEIVPVDPRDWRPDMRKKSPKFAEEPARRIKRHPGISIFYFSLPVMFIFAVGLRVVQHGGEGMVRAGEFYMGLYTVSALSLLMLSSLAGLREYFRARRIRIPAGIGPWWIGIGAVMMAIVLVTATVLPMPAMPPIAYVDYHETDYWTRDSTFSLRAVTASSMDVLEQSKFMYRLRVGVGVCLGLFVAYGALRAVGAAAARIARKRHRWPRFVVRFFDWVDRLLLRLLRLPKLPTLQRRPRISRHIATCVRFRNPMADPARRDTLTPRDAIEQSYEALCALAYDLGVPRADDQTPYEFIAAFPKPLRGIQEEAAELTELYVTAAYSPAQFDEKTLDRLRKFWMAYEVTRAKAVK